MTRNANATAGLTFLACNALRFASMIFPDRAMSGKGIAARLENMARYTSDVRLAMILTPLTSFCALVTGVTLCALTRDQDPDLAILLWLATVIAAKAPDISATFLTVGSTPLSRLLFMSPLLATRLSPYLYLPGMVGERVLTAWLLTAGVDVKRWQEQAGAMGASVRS